ncbi:putative cubilin, partial [Ophiophagus hannah]
MDRSPADDEDGHYDENQPSNTPEVPVLLLRSREDPDIFQAPDHEAVADGDHHDWDHEGEKKNADSKNGLPVVLGFRKSNETVNFCRSKETQMNK